MFLGTHTPQVGRQRPADTACEVPGRASGGLMVTKGQDHCLYVFPRAEFEQMARKVAAAPFTNEAVRAYQRYLFAGTDEQRPDGQGRIADRTGAASLRRPDQGVRGHRRGHPDGDLGRAGVAALPGGARGQLRGGSGGGASRRLLRRATRTGAGPTRAVRPRSARLRPTALAHLPRRQVRVGRLRAGRGGGSVAPARRLAPDCQFHSSLDDRSSRAGIERVDMTQHHCTEPHRRARGASGRGRRHGTGGDIPTSPELAHERGSPAGAGMDPRRHVPVLLDRVLELFAPALTGRPRFSSTPRSAWAGTPTRCCARTLDLTLVGLDRDPRRSRGPGRGSP